MLERVRHGGLEVRMRERGYHWGSRSGRLHAQVADDASEISA